MAREERIGRAGAQAGVRAPRTRVFAALAHRDFRLLIIGNLFTQLGQWTQQVGNGWLIYKLTGSPLQLTLVPFCSGAAMFIGAPFGGAMADRFDRRKIMMVTQVALMANALVLAFLVLTDTVQIWHLYGAALWSGFFFALNGPSRQTLVNDLVGKKDLANAIALNTVTMNSMRVIGPALGGTLLATGGIEGPYFLQAGTYVAAVGLVLMMRPARAPETRGRDPFIKSMKAGAVYARRDPTIFKLLTVAFVAGLLGMSYMPLMPAYVGDILKMDRGSVFGWLMTAGGVGGLIGAVAITLAGDVRWKGRLLLAAVFGTGVLQLGLGALGYLQENALGPIIPVLAGLGLANAITLTMANTLLQTNVEDEYRGRVMAIYFISFSLQPLGSLAGGAIADSLGLEPSLILMGALVAAATLWIAVTSPRVRRL